jgi:predicted unusual protein kinase regulating ubiquinone biosynthesis (AarF/ABC1/UbiB family)
VASARAPGAPPNETELLGRAAEIGRVLARHGLRERGDGSRAAQAKRLRAALEELGPTFAKLGQVLSTRPDLMPPEFIEELAMLQEEVTPLTEAEVVAVMEEELRVPWEDVFESIEPAPLAAGTIGQVHRAMLETGERVVVKVQRPNARPDIERDLGLLERFAERTADRPAFRQVIDTPVVVQHLSDSLRRELDFRQEMANMERMRDVLAPYPRLAVPRVYGELSTARLLVMEEVRGVPVREAPVGDERRDAARQLLESFYHQILGVGFFHADPHPGNMKWWDGRLYFLDFGMVGEVAPETRQQLLLLILAFSREDVPFLADILILLSGGTPSPDLDVATYHADIGALMRRHKSSTLNEIELGPVLQDLTEISTRHEIRLPASLALTGKALAQMQLAAAELDPELDPLSVASRFFVGNLTSRLRDRLDIQQLIYDAQKTRVRFGRIAEAFERLTGARAGPSLQVRFTGTERLEDTIRRAARRLALALTAGTCIVAAAITVDSDAGSWVPLTLGIFGGALALGLVVDLVWPKRKA